MADTNDQDEAAGRHQEDEDAMAQMLRLAGVRLEVAPERRARVQAAVHDAWLASRRRARRMKIYVGATVAAAAALLVIVLWPRPIQPPSASPGLQTVARSERTIGAPRLERAADRDSNLRKMAAGMTLVRGDVIETDLSSAGALTTGDGTSVRLDSGSRIRLLSAKSIDLLQGRIYIATAKGATGFEVRTRFGTVHDRGTRFEVRLDESALRLRIRDGAVELKDGSKSMVTAAGHETVVTARGAETRPLVTYGSEWDWTDRLRPPFDIEGRTLAQFLEHLAGEEGWSLDYADGKLERTASTVILHGSIEGLSAEDALSVAISTSGFRYRLQHGTLLVLRPSDRR
jgi:ferric-dicitrate binding protein FerR (iron transport regulator)